MSQLLKIRPAEVQDTERIFSLIIALAEYENLSDSVTGSSDKLREDLFGENACIEAIVAEWDQEVVGFALFFSNYSTFLTRSGIYLEDIFVLSEYRRLGIGGKMLNYIAKLAQQRNCGRLEWSVLDWNQKAIAFYEKIGATVLPDWRICRVTGDALVQLSEYKE